MTMSTIINIVAVGRGEKSVKTALKSIFRKSQVRSISEKFGLNLNAQIVCLSPSQWVNCFLEMLEVVPEKFHPS